MLMHAIAHGGCRDTVREFALKVDYGRKIACRAGDSNPAFESDALPIEKSRPCMAIPSIIIILRRRRRISRAPIYCTRWEHKALYNNTNNTQTHKCEQCMCMYVVCMSSVCLYVLCV